MGANNVKVLTDRFPNPDTHEHVRAAYEHLQSKGVKFEVSNLKENGGCTMMCMPEGWSFLRLDGEYQIILNADRMPEVLYYVDTSKALTEMENVLRGNPVVQELEEGMKEDLKDRVEVNSLNDAVKNLSLYRDSIQNTKERLTFEKFSSITDAARAVAPELAKTVTVRCDVLTGWNDPQIPAYLLERFTIPLPEFYQVNPKDRLMERVPFEKWTHLGLLAAEIKELKRSARSCFGRQLDKWGPRAWTETYEPKLLKLREYVNNHTDMHRYAEYRKYTNFLNGPILKTPEEICEHLNNRYKKYCQMTPADRKYFDIGRKIHIMSIHYDEIIEFADGLDYDNLDYNPEKNVFVVIQTPPPTIQEC